MVLNCTCGLASAPTQGAQAPYGIKITTRGAPDVVFTDECMLSVGAAEGQIY